MTGISILIGAIYSFVIGTFYYGFLKKTPLKINSNNAQNCFSILIAFRNEAQNLPELLNSLQQLSYPTTAFEIIFIDDHSSDASVKIIETFSKQNPLLNLKLLSNKNTLRHPLEKLRMQVQGTFPLTNNTGKKAAISLGIEHASYDWILTTDADCKVPKQWLHTYNTLLQEKDYKFIAGPVAFEGNKTFLHQFQDIDFLSLQGSTIGSFALGKPFMSNAANSGFHKPTFQKLQGFDGNKNIASGDDVFLLEKMTQQYPTQIGFLNSKEAIVSTQPQNNWKQLLHQRMRWAAKATASRNFFGVFVGIVIFSCNLLIGILAVLNLEYAVYFILGKGIVDYILIRSTATFFSKKIAIGNYLISALLYPIFSVSIFLCSLFFKFEWKGRRFRK